MQPNPMPTPPTPGTNTTAQPRRLQAVLEFTAQTSATFNAQMQKVEEQTKRVSAAAKEAQDRVKSVAGGVAGTAGAAELAAGGAMAGGGLGLAAIVASVTYITGQISKSLVEIGIQGRPAAAALADLVYQLPLVGGAIRSTMTSISMMTNYSAMKRLYEFDRVTAIENTRMMGDSSLRGFRLGMEREGIQSGMNVDLARFAESQAVGQLGSGALFGGFGAATREAEDPRLRQAQLAAEQARIRSDGVNRLSATAEEALFDQSGRFLTADERTRRAGSIYRRDVADRKRRTSGMLGAFVATGLESFGSSIGSNQGLNISQSPVRTEYELQVQLKELQRDTARLEQERLTLQQRISESAAAEQAAAQATLELKRRQTEVDKVRIQILGEEEQQARAGELQFGSMSFSNQLALRNAAARAKEEGWGSLSEEERSLLLNSGMTRDFAAKFASKSADESYLAEEVRQITGGKRSRDIAAERLRLQQDVEIRVTTDERVLAERIAETLKKEKDSLYNLLEAKIKSDINQQRLGIEEAQRARNLLQ